MKVWEIISYDILATSSPCGVFTQIRKACHLWGDTALPVMPIDADIHPRVPHGPWMAGSQPSLSHLVAF